MLTSLLVFMLLRFRRQHPDRFLRMAQKALFLARVLVLLALGMSIHLVARAQERQLVYTVRKGDHPIGFIRLTEQRQEGRLVLRLQSEIDYTLILRFLATAKEESVYENGRLVYSSVYRKMNEREKANYLIRMSDKGYFVKWDNESKFLTAHPITYSTLCLYVQEPKTATVFSDKHQQFLPVEKIGANLYRVQSPDGGYNTYRYEKGVCVSIHVKNNLYQAIIELNR